MRFIVSSVSVQSIEDLQRLVDLAMEKRSPTSDLACLPALPYLYEPPRIHGEKYK
ncbi:MAG: hypothetical protein ACI9D5_001566 [Candidatus Endobugula sp.]|jgi:hypothetical protein